jgi:hypothetical protein
MTYYRLRCQTCRIDFEPLLATKQGELQFPDFEEVREMAGESNADRLECFHREHAGRGHELVEIKGNYIHDYIRLFFKNLWLNRIFPLLSSV